MMEPQKVVPLLPVGHADDSRLGRRSDSPSPARISVSAASAASARSRVGAADALIVGVADEHPETACRSGHPRSKRCKTTLASKGESGPPWGLPHRDRQHRTVEHPGRQDGPDQPQHLAVTDPLPQAFENKIMIEPVEEGLDVGIHHPRPARPHRLPHGLQGLMRAALGPEPVASRAGSRPPRSARARS